MRKSLWIIPLLFVAIWARATHADSVETYTGNPYTTFPGTDSGYTTANRITATLTFENPLPVDATLTDGVGGFGPPTAADPLLGFVISDGTLTYSIPSDTFNIWLVTGNQGQIVNWFIGGCAAPCGSSINIDSYSVNQLDSSAMGGTNLVAYEVGHPGTWTATVTPEPSSLLLLGFGLLGLIGLRKKVIA